jgi:hypothetical protein
MYAGVVEVRPTVDERGAAEGLYTFGALNNSIMQGRSNGYGALGEVLFASRFPDWQKVESYNHDFVGPTGTVDVKTKKTSVDPLGNYNCSVAATSEHQQPDHYFFVRVHDAMRIGWLLGWLPREEFYRRAFFARKGELEPGTGWPFKADCWNVRVDQLLPVGAFGLPRWQGV